MERGDDTADDGRRGRGNRCRRWLRRCIIGAVVAVVIAPVLYLPVLEIYIRATSYPADGATMKLWRQRCVLHADWSSSEPLFRVEIPGSKRKQFGYIDETGNLVIDGPFRWAHNFSEGLAAVAVESPVGERWGFIDPSGAFVIPPRYVGPIGPFREGIAEVHVDGSRGERTGFIDADGNWVIPPGRFGAKAFVDGIAELTVHPPSHWPALFLTTWPSRQPRRWFIDTRGNRLGPADLRDFDVDTAPPIPVQMGDEFGSEYEFHNGDGVNVFNRRFESARGFSEGLAPVSQNGLWGFIDRTGSIVITPQYSEAHEFQNGFAAVRSVRTGKFGLIDRSGHLVLPAEYNWIVEYRDGLVHVTAERAGVAYWAYVTLDNEQVWPPLGAADNAEPDP